MHAPKGGTKLKNQKWWIQNPPIAVEDITKLVVDQNVFIFSGIYYVTGKVTKVSPGGVEVFVFKSNTVSRTNQVWRFDSQGETSDGGGGTAEYGPWEIDAMPFEARRAELAELALKREFFNKKYPNGSVLPANEPLPPV
jgi:hypothetical protein